MLFLFEEMLIGDIKAPFEAIGAIGVSGTLLCFHCRRVLGWRSFSNPAIAAKCAEFANLGSLDQRQCGKHTDASLRQTLQDIADVAGQGDADALKAKQTLNGYKHLPSNLLVNPLTVMMPLLVIMMDWMHLFFQSGNWNREVYAVLAAATSRAFNAYEQLWEYVKAFTFPAAFASAATLFSKSHWE